MRETAARSVRERYGFRKNDIVLIWAIGSGQEVFYVRGAWRAKGSPPKRMDEPAVARLLATGLAMLIHGGRQVVLTPEGRKVYEELRDNPYARARKKQIEGAAA